MKQYYKEILEQLDLVTTLVKNVRNGDDAYQAASRVDISCLEQAFILNNMLQDIKRYVKTHFYTDGVPLLSRQAEETLIDDVLSAVYDDYTDSEYHKHISNLLENGFNKLKQS